VDQLAEIRQTRFLSTFKPEWVNVDKSLNTEKLFTMFQEFWRENSRDAWRAVEQSGTTATFGK